MRRVYIHIFSIFLVVPVCDEIEEGEKRIKVYLSAFSFKVLVIITFVRAFVL